MLCCLELEESNIGRLCLPELFEFIISYSYTKTRLFVLSLAFEQKLKLISLSLSREKLPLKDLFRGQTFYFHYQKHKHVQCIHKKKRALGY